MKKISKFDLGVIIAFILIGLIGGGACYYVHNTILGDELAKVRDAKNQYDTYAVNQTYNVTDSNKKVLQSNIDAIKSQLDPLIQTKFLSKDNKLAGVERKDPVAWKHDLDDDVTHLSGLAKAHGVKLPANFYFSFSRYISQNPADAQTVVLGKQLLVINELSKILIDDSVDSIESIKRTYEEDPRATGNGGGANPANAGEDRLVANSFTARGGVYTVYPFEIDFDSSTESFRKVVNDLMQSPYIFIIRTVNVENSEPNSPQVADLDKIAGVGDSASVVESAPGAVAATDSSKAPQYLFGNASLHIKARVDLVEWTSSGSDTAPPPKPNKK